MAETAKVKIKMSRATADISGSLDVVIPEMFVCVSDAAMREKIILRLIEINKNMNKGVM